MSIETTLTWNWVNCTHVSLTWAQHRKQQIMGEGGLSSVDLIGRSWRTWKTNRIYNTHLPYWHPPASLKVAPPHLEPTQLGPHPPPIPLECRRSQALVQLPFVNLQIAIAYLLRAQTLKLLQPAPSLGWASTCRHRCNRLPSENTWTPSSAKIAKWVVNLWSIALVRCLCDSIDIFNGIFLNDTPALIHPRCGLTDT